MKHACVSASLCLSEGKQQRQVALDAFLFQLFGSADTFPGRGQLDQDAITADTGLVVQLDQTFCALDAGVGVERDAGVHFGGNTARHHFQNFLADRHGETVAGQADVILRTAEGFFQAVGVAVAGGGFEQQGRVGGGINRLELFNGSEIASIGDDGGDFFELFQLGSHERALSCGCDDITRAPPVTQGRKPQQTR